MQRYELALSEPNRVFFSGDDILGHVDLTLDTDMTVQGKQYFNIYYGK